MNIKVFRLVYLGIIAIFLSSCVPIKKVKLVQEDQDNLTEVMKSINVEDTRVYIRPSDELYIDVTSISSLTQTDHNFFSSNRMPSSGGAADYTLISFSVNDSGYVRLPVIGNVKVLNLTKDEAAEIIEQKLQPYITNPSVKVKYVNRQITVLGEVVRPGTYFYNKDKMSIMQGIGLAGDFGYYGNRKKVLLLRSDNDTIHKVNIDLLAEESMQSEYYYLQNNDIIYVEPLKARKWGIQSFPWALILSAVSVTILTLSFIQNN